MIEYPEDPETKLIRNRRGITTIDVPVFQPVPADINDMLDTYRKAKEILRRADIARGKIVLTKEVTENAVNQNT